MATFAPQTTPLDEALAPAAVDSTDAASLFLAAVWALDRNRPAESATLAGEIRDLGARKLADGDSTTAGQTAAMAEALDGFRDLRAGRREEALRKLQAARPRIAGQLGEWIVNMTIGWWAAGLLVDLGRPAEAALYFESITNAPFAQLELGKIYEALGRREEAREQYETALEYWREADPELAPRIAEARQRLSGLGFQPRG